MTGNVAQVFLTDDDLRASLRGIEAALAPGGHLAFEARDPARRAWTEWTRERTRTSIDVAGVGPIDTWIDLLDVDGQLVTFRQTYRFAATAAVLTSDSTLRFRERHEIAASLAATGFTLLEVRGAPDRPGRELVFVAAVAPGSSADRGRRE